jgi:hypothetical protein
VHDRIDFKVPLFDPEGSDPQRAVRETIIDTFVCPSDLPGPTESRGVFDVGREDGHAEDGHDHDDDGDDHAPHPVDGGDLATLCRSAKANYVGVFGWERSVDDDPAGGDGVFFRNSRIGIKHISDGTSKTIVLGERSARLGGSVWTGVIHGAEAARARVVGVGDHAPNDAGNHFDDFSSRHPAGSVFVQADAATRFLADGIDRDVFRGLCTRAGGEAVPTGP